MLKVVLVAFDLLLEASSRRWILAMLGAITLGALTLSVTLQMDVVDGVIAGTRLFGDLLSSNLGSSDAVLRPVYTAGSWFVFVAGLLFGIVACSDFATELLAPGRIEQLLALPLERWQLTIGTYLGVMVIALLGTGYAGGMFSVLLGIKSGVWSPAIMVGGLAAVIAFAGVYGAMLASAVFARSSALAMAVGGALTAAGFGLTQPELAVVFERGLTRDLFVGATACLPRLWLLGHLGPAAAGFENLPAGTLRTAIGTLVFGAACVAIATSEFERKDF